MTRKRAPAHVLCAYLTVAVVAAIPAALASAADTPAPPTTLANLIVAKDLPVQLAKFRQVHMAFDAQALSSRERQMVEKLVEASRYLGEVYWEQSDPGALVIYRDLKSDHSPAAEPLRRFLRINGSRYSLIQENRPFIGTTPMPPGRNLFPADLTRTEFDAFVAAHPTQKAALYDPFTIVRRSDVGLQAVPYHVAYRKWLEPMAAALRAAAALSDDPAFDKFLRMRADALLDDDYFQSDLAWLDLENPKVDVIFAPYETYLDDLLGVKTSYGAAVLIRNDAESRKLDLYKRYVADIQAALPLPPEDLPSKKGLRSPMQVMDSPFRAGDLRHGYQAVADNLPNDPRVHEQRGSKKIFFKNYMDARVEYIILPIAKRLLRPDLASLASAEGYVATTIMHEISHGLGPAFARVGGQKKDIREAIGPAYSGLEEAKADIVGLFGLKWLVEHGVVPREKLDPYYISHIAGIFRTVRFGVGEAHGRAEMMEFNYLSARSVVLHDAATGLYSVDLPKMPAAIAALARELLVQEATGDRARTEAWFKKYGTMPAELETALQAAADVPVDIDPVQDFPEN